MYEISEYIKRKHKLSTVILKCPNGWYTIVGSVPIELTHERIHSLTPNARDANVYDTEQEIISALLGVGITHFQKSDCTWYDK